MAPPSQQTPCALSDLPPEIILLFCHLLEHEDSLRFLSSGRQLFQLRTSSPDYHIAQASLKVNSLSIKQRREGPLPPELALELLDLAGSLQDRPLRSLFERLLALRAIACLNLLAGSATLRLPCADAGSDFWIRRDPPASSELGGHIFVRCLRDRRRHLWRASLVSYQRLSPDCLRVFGLTTPGYAQQLVRSYFLDHGTDTNVSAVFSLFFGTDVTRHDVTTILHQCERLSVWAIQEDLPSVFEGIVIHAGNIASHFHPEYAAHPGGFRVGFVALNSDILLNYLGRNAATRCWRILFEYNIPLTPTQEERLFHCLALAACELTMIAKPEAMRPATPLVAQTPEDAVHLRRQATLCAKIFRGFSGLEARRLFLGPHLGSSPWQTAVRSGHYAFCEALLFCLEDQQGMALPAEFCVAAAPSSFYQYVRHDKILTVFLPVLSQNSVTICQLLARLLSARDLPRTADGSCILPLVALSFRCSPEIFRLFYTDMDFTFTHFPFRFLLDLTVEAYAAHGQQPDPADPFAITRFRDFTLAYPEAPEAYASLLTDEVSACARELIAVYCPDAVE